MSTPPGLRPTRVVAGTALRGEHHLEVHLAGELGYHDEISTAQALVSRLRSRDLGLYGRVHVDADASVLRLDASSAADLQALEAHLAALPPVQRSARAL